MTDDADIAEDLALTLTRYGLQRMTARVLSTLLFAEQETITAGEIAERLDASPGSVSTAIKTLSGTKLIEQVPVAGRRRAHYRFPADGWERLMSAQNEAMQAMLDAAEHGIHAAGRDSIAGHRLVDMRDFYAHIMRELPQVIDRWRAGSRRRPE